MHCPASRQPAEKHTNSNANLEGSKTQRISKVKFSEILRVFEP